VVAATVVTEPLFSEGFERQMSLMLELCDSERGEGTTPFQKIGAVGTENLQKSSKTRTILLPVPRINKLLMSSFKPLDASAVASAGFKPLKKVCGKRPYLNMITNHPCVDVIFRRLLSAGDHLSTVLDQ
jgi:hypothetical protein